MNRYGIEGDTLLVEVSDRIATLTLNRPDQHNALARVLRENLTRAFVGIEKDSDVDVVIVTGAGGKAFCAGVDLKELETSPLTPDDMGFDCAFMQALAALSKPMIAAVNGFAVAGGFEIAGSCDVIVASTSARFADTHCRVGVVSAWGFTQTLRMLIGPVRARYLSFTGNYIDAPTAKAWGLAIEMVAPEELMPYCRKMAAEMSSCDQLTLKRVRECMRLGELRSVMDGLELEAKYAKESAVNLDLANFGARRATVMDRGRGQV
jgi:enoyl-CoA hydratase